MIIRTRAVVVVAALVASHGAIAERARQPQTPVADALILHFPRTLDTTGLQIHYTLYGRGSYGSFVLAEPGVWDYRIPATTRWATNDFGPPTSVKADIIVPGYSVVLIDIPSLSDRPTREVTVDLKPLPPVTIHGRAQPPAEGWNVHLVIDVEYAPSWECRFYGSMDCMIGIAGVAQSSPLGADGVFSVRVPDFGHDPALAVFSERGEFYFTVRDPQTLAVRYRLARERGLDPMHAPYALSPLEASAASLVLYPYPPG